MFQFTTTTVINNPTASTVGSDFVTWSEGAYRVIDKDSKGTALADDKKIFKVTEGPAFKKGDVTAIYVAPYKAETPDTCTIDLDGLSTSDYYRIALYIRSIGNADPTFANTRVFKGMPLYVEFKGGEDVTDIAKRIHSLVLDFYGEKIITVTTSGTSLVLTGINGYQRFTYIALEKWTADTSVEGGHYEVVKSTTNGDYTVTVGCEGYGTYEQVLKDLRLPTGDNLAYKSLNEAEMPVLDGEYTQVTVQMCKDLLNYPGGIGVNNPVKSITNHVFFINGDASTFISDLEDVTKATHKEVPTTTTAGA